LLKEELLNMKENNKDQFNLYFTVDVQPDEKENWSQGVGFITKEMLLKNLPKPSEVTIILYCGPPLFEKLVKTRLTELGYSDSMMFKF
jgi:cytochrome-b5 reductase